MQRFGSIFFVDRASGSDSHSGKTPTEALLTLDAAVALCTDYAGDVIVFKGRTTSGQKFTDYQTINKVGVKLIGAGSFFGGGAAYDSTFVCPQTPTAHGLDFGVPCGLLVEAGGVEIAGIKFYNPDATKIQAEVEGNCDYGSGRATGIVIHDCIFQGQNAGTADRTRGIELIGTEQAILYRNQYYCAEYGIYMRSGSYHNAQGCIIQGERIYGSKYGLFLDTNVCDNLFDDILVGQKSNTGYAMTNGVKVHTLSTGNTFRNVDVGHATKTTAFAPGAGANAWLKCYYGITGGTLFDGAES
jgi:hypothetical protein